MHIKLQKYSKKYVAKNMLINVYIVHHTVVPSTYWSKNTRVLRIICLHSLSDGI